MCVERSFFFLSWKFLGVRMSSSRITLFNTTQPHQLKVTMMKRLRQHFDCDHKLFVTAQTLLCFGGQLLIADLCVSPCPLLDKGEWQVTLNCVVLLRWHANLKDWERPLAVYSPNQSKLCDEKAECLIITWNQNACGKASQSHHTTCQQNHPITDEKHFITTTSEVCQVSSRVSSLNSYFTSVA